MCFRSDIQDKKDDNFGIGILANFNEALHIENILL